MWRNEWEIADICDTLVQSNDKRLVGYSLVLAHWVNIINSHSDGWSYWKVGAKAAEKLSDLLARAAGHHSAGRDVIDADRRAHQKNWLDWPEGGEDAWQYVPTDAELRSALTPMKTLATKYKLPSPLKPLEELAKRSIETPRPSSHEVRDEDGLWDSVAVMFPTFILTVRENTVDLGGAVIEVTRRGISTTVATVKAEE